MEFTWDGHTFGDGQDRLTRVDWGSHDLRSQVVLLPQNHGGVGGDDWAGLREVELELLVSRNSRADAESAWDLWHQIMQPTSVDGELRWTRADGDTRLMFVRPRPLLVDWLPGACDFRAKARWVAYDPAIYAGSLQQVALEPYAGTALASYPATWPLLGNYPKLYGAGGTGGGVQVNNAGNWASWPRLIIGGPAAGAMSVTSIEDVTHGQALQFTANGGLTVAAGSTLVVDTHPARRLVAFTDGASRMDRVTDLDSWWPVEPGTSEVRFRAGGDTAGATVQLEFRDAWL